jgi:MYXO-CTERM domain-containing protein
MKRLTLSTAMAVTLLFVSSADATAPAEDLLEAMEIERGWIVDGTVSTPGSSATMFTVLQSLGVLSPNDPQTMALISTGNTKNISDNRDYDYPGDPTLDDSDADHATLRVELDVPEFANSFSFDFFFLSREYPEWVGEEFNDTFEVWLSSGAFNGQIVFDSAGNAVNVNNGLFTVVYDEDDSPDVLSGTGFDVDGGTGWVTTVAPCVPGERMSLSFEVYDVADGIWDSAVLLDRFRFSTDEQKDPTSDHTPNDDLELGYASPKEASLGGGGEVLLHGGGFDGNTVIQWGDYTVPSASIDSGDVFIISSIPSAAEAGVPEGGNIDITLTRDTDVVVLASGFTYHDDAPGETRPWVTSVLPGSVHPDGETEMRVRGSGMRPGLSVYFVAEDGTETAARVELVQAAEGGQMATVMTPAHAEGWVEVVVENASGLRSEPGYPVEVTANAINTNYADDGDGSDNTCSITGPGSAGLGVGLLLLGLIGVRRREGSLR